MRKLIEKRLRAIIYFGILGCLLYLSNIFLNCSPDKSQDSLSIKGNYLGDQACQSCHQKEYEDWNGSHHQLAMQTANELNVLGDFNNVSFSSNGVISQFFKKDGKHYVNTEGEEGNLQDFEVKYAFGVEPLQQYMIQFPNGRVQCLLIAWDTQKNQWFDLMPQNRLAPDDWLHWTKGSMNWNTMCADCHSTDLKKNFDVDLKIYDTQWSSINVSCESCHGPGGKHLQYINSNGHLGEDKVSDSYLYQVNSEDKKQQVEDCAHCHSRRSPITNSYVNDEEFMDQYIPSLINPGLYHTDGQILDEVYVYGSFVQSKMYRRDVGCTDCHNPHSLELKLEGNNLCTQCHIKEKYDVISHHFHPVDTESSKCINCHMPGKYYMGNDFRRDHSFRVPRPDLSAKYDTPNACIGCHQDKSDEWASEAIVRWYGKERPKHFSTIMTSFHAGEIEAIPKMISMVSDTSVPPIIQATAIGFLGDFRSSEINQEVQKALKNESSIIRHSAVGALANASKNERLEYLSPMLNDPIRSVRAFASYAMADISKDELPEVMHEAYDNAKNDFEQQLDIQADFPGGQLMRGQYLQKKGQLDLAKQAYLECINQDPYLATPHYNVATIYYIQKNHGKAKISFKNAISRDSNYIDAYFSLGLLSAELGDLIGAEINLQKAAILSGNPRYYYNWGLTLQNLNLPLKAEKAYLNALAILPNSEVNLNALAILYIQQKKRGEAKIIVTRLLQLYPQNEKYIKMMGMVK